jgi:demethylmenaquinone methyltransferase/2-methoxy-6-polyprenyl-1,4-benzoquinol methylase
VLEFSRPKQKLFHFLYHVYLKIVAPKAGSIFAHNKDAYRYLNYSVQAFPEREQFTALMKQSGFNKIYFKQLTLGVCCIYCGSK